ncbi:MAG: T9SS type A sorting domain-containing protein [Prevotellaceae bacterium]|nr:T9SS type A sorting domain-containing protein [Prevotellaceae bacterium]
MKKLFSFVSCFVLVTSIAVAEKAQPIVALNFEEGGIDIQSSSPGDKCVASRNPGASGINTSPRSGKYTHKSGMWTSEEHQVGRLNPNVPTIHLGYYDSFEYKVYVPSTTNNGDFMIVLCSDGPDRGTDPNVERENWEVQYTTYPSIPEDENYNSLRDTWAKVERGGYVSGRELGMFQFGFRRGEAAPDPEKEIVYFDDLIFRPRQSNKICTYKESFFFYGKDNSSWTGNPNQEVTMYPGTAWSVALQTGKDRWVGGVELKTNSIEFEWVSGKDHVLVLASDLDDILLEGIPVLSKLKNLSLAVDVKTKAPKIEYRANGTGDWTAIDFSKSGTAVGGTWNTFEFDLGLSNVNTIDLRLSGKEISSGVSNIDNITIWGTDEEWDWSTASVPNVSVSSINMYPNPVTDILKVDGDFHQIDIYDIQGKLVVSDSGKRSEINVSHLPGGMYVTKVHTVEGVFSSKIFKK